MTKKKYLAVTLLLPFFLMHFVQVLDASPDANSKATIAANDNTETTSESRFDRYESSINRGRIDMHQPWKLLRAIQRQQDRIVFGEKDAAKAYQILLVQSANWMNNLDDQTWQNERNLNALAAHILIGGKVELGYKALQKTKLAEEETLLLRAAIAYSEREVAKAHELISTIDHFSLPPSIAGQVALAKAMIYSSSDLVKAASYLKQARLLAPGTLIEEAAIRRAIRIASELKAADDIKYLYRTYLRRFSSSHYFADFLRNVSYAFVEISEGSGNSIIPEFENFIHALDKDQQTKVAIYVARRATITGRFELSRWVTDFAIKRVETGSKVHTRLMLYAVASRNTILGETENTLLTAKSINMEHLGKYDKKILEAVNILGERILSNEMPVERSEPVQKQKVAIQESELDSDSALETDAENESENFENLESRSERLKTMMLEMNKYMSEELQ